MRGQGAKKYFLPGGGGAGSIIRGWRLRGQGAKIFFFARGRWCRRHYQGVEVKTVMRGQGAKPFFRFDPFFKIQFKNTSNLILLGFKMSSERFLFKDLKTGLTF